MSTFDPDKITVMYFPPTTAFRPVYGRTYAVVHQGEIDKLLVNIGNHGNSYLIERENENIILAKWVLKMGQLVLMVKIPRGTNIHDEKLMDKYFHESHQVLSFYLKAMITADTLFYSHFPWLLDSPIYVQFDPLTESKNSVHFAGTPRNYVLPRKIEGDFSLIC